MLAAILSFALVSLLVSPSVAQSYTSIWGFCFLSSSVPNSPYGPWSVALGGIISTSAPFYFNSSGTPASAGGQRWAQMVTAASVTRTQLNRDGSVSTASLGLAAVGVQGSDNVFFNSTPYTNWNGIAFSVTSSSDRPFAGATDWVVYPNDFPVQAVELYYDLPTYNYPTEYHCDNQVDAVMTIQAGSAPTCTPAPITAPLQSAALTFQFCYQAYAAANTATNQPAWQTSIQGTFLTQTGLTQSTISGQTGLYILSVTGTRTQVANGVTTSVPIVGQAWHNSGGGDGNEFGDDPLLLTSAPLLVPNRGFVLYAANRFTYPNGTLSDVDYFYSKVNANPLSVVGTSVVESLGPKPDWSALAVSCSCSALTCPTISSNTNAAPVSSPSTSCTAVSSSTSASMCSSAATVASSTAALSSPSSSSTAFSSSAAYVASSAAPPTPASSTALVLAVSSSTAAGSAPLHINAASRSTTSAVQLPILAVTAASLLLLTLML